MDVEELESADGVGRLRVCGPLLDRAVLPCWVPRYFVYVTFGCNWWEKRD